MESLKHHRLPVWIAVAVVLLAPFFSATLVWADGDPIEDPVDTWVTTGPDEITVEAETEHHDEGPTGTGTQASGGDGPRCYMREIPTSEWDEDMSMMFFYFRMQRAPYRVICDGEPRGIVWLPIDLSEPGEASDDRVDPRDVALRMRDEIPVPGAGVEINPTRGLVGAESWFWIQGYDGRPITDSTDAFGVIVDVEARVTRYEWSFGDGATSVSETPGRAYPSRSEVRHVYERSSAGLTNGYEVEVAFVFAVRYRVDGGSWIELPGITRIARADYPVRESQAVIQR